MDCETFDRVILDSLYDEVDDLTQAAARRHTQRCGRCASIDSRFRAAREIGVVPLEPAPVGLKERIVRAERTVQASLSPGQRAGRAISVLAEYAMRPELAMAALLLLMIGSSLLFLRVKPNQGERGAVTERGVADSEHETPIDTTRSRTVPTPRTESSTEASAGDERSDAATEVDSAREREATATASRDAEAQYEKALRAYRARHYREAERLFSNVAELPGPKRARALLFAARSARRRNGCGSAVGRFDAVLEAYPTSDSAAEATWDAAECERELGELHKASARYRKLLDVPLLSLRAKAALERLEPKLRNQPVPGDDADAGDAGNADSAPNAVTPSAPATAPHQAGDAGVDAR